MKFDYEDGFSVETQPNPPYGIRARLFDPNGKLVKQDQYPPDEEEHWIADLIYINRLMEQ
jgi:hypothetical protein